ncbi:MAG: hypothetical protein ACYCYE_08360 [Clostridia bacterium]
MNKIIVLLFFSVICVLSVFSSSYAWGKILQCVANRDIAIQIPVDIFVKSNIAKYLPGNVMHLVGRNVIGNILGLEHIDILSSTILDIVFISIASAFISIGIIIQNSRMLSQIFIIENFRFVLLLIPLILIVYITNIKKDNRISSIKDILNRIKTKQFIEISIKVIIIYMLQFIYVGAILALILIFFMKIKISFTLFIYIIEAFTLAWFIGFITPGSPGGIGIRETVLFVLLSAYIVKQDIIISIMLHRLVSILGDFNAFGIWNLYKYLKHRM